jgi:uncharacterized protein YneF (UPF0154 family)
MKKIELMQRDFLFALAVVMLLIVLSFGFGYFIGRYEQAQTNKSLLRKIPDVNCGTYHVTKGT